MDILEFEQRIPSKSISYLRARDPSILAYGHPIPNGKDLYNELLECTGNTTGNTAQDHTHLHVYLRMKKTETYKNLYEISDDNTLVCKVPEGAQCIRNIRADVTSVTRTFKFSKIFGPNAQQIDVFNDVVKGKVLHFINGSNCSLLSYGASGSGKTYTIVGTANEPGIVPRALEYLFRTLPQLPEEPYIKPEAAGGIIRLTSIARKSEKNASHNLLNNSTFNIDRAQHIRTYKVMQQRLSDEPVAVIADDIRDVYLSIWVSFAEIYNECVYDLLTPEPPRGQPRRKLRLGQCRGISYIKDLTCINVRSGLEAFQILQYGLHNLKYAATSINDHSSRSHSIFTIKLAQASDTKDGYSVSSFHFCDLAGSERLKKTHNVGDRLKESNNINTSLLVLGRCVSLIREAQKQNSFNMPIPFRESKLTQLFQRALLGHELISMIVNINPTREMFDESCHVLNFSAIAKDVTIEQQPLVRRLPRTNRFSQYVENKHTVIPTVVEEEYDNTVDELMSQIADLVAEREQQKLEAKEDREFIINTYKKLLNDAHEYWEKRCEKLECMTRNNKPIVIQGSNDNATKQDVSVINLDSSVSSDDESSPNNFTAAQNEIAELKQLLQEKDEAIKNLYAEKKSLEQTVEDAVKAYKELQMQYENTIKQMQIEIIHKEDQIGILQSHFNSLHVGSNATCDSNEDKENTDISNIQEHKPKVFN